jgi:hypothetical protein
MHQVRREMKNCAQYCEYKVPSRRRVGIKELKEVKKCKQCFKR